MTFSALRYFVLSIGLMSASAFAAEEVRDLSTGAVFPPTVTFEDNGKTYNLQATGVSTRKKFFVKVYSIASYLQEGAHKNGGDIIREILQDDNAKQLTLKWVRNAPVDKVKEGYVESFREVLGSDYPKMQGQVDQFIQLFNNEIKKDDEHVLRWMPGGLIEVFINGHQVGSFTNKDFAKALWSIWFGQKSVVNRDALVSLAR